MSDNKDWLDEIFEMIWGGALDVTTSDDFKNSKGDLDESKYVVAKYNISKTAKSLLLTKLEEAIGKRIELRADIDDELLKFVPDMEERSLEVTGVPSSFTNLYTRQIVRSTQDQIRQNLGLKERGDE